MDEHQIKTLIIAAPLLAMTGGGDACAAGAGYRTRVRGNRVIICSDAIARQCPDPEGMLRQRLGRRHPRLLSQACVKRGPLVCYVDECVPAGTYRYGLARPYRCHGGPTDYFVEVEVEAELDVDLCRRRRSRPPRRYRLDPPWRGRGATVCGSHCGSCSAAGEDLETVALVDVGLGLGLLVWVWRRRGRREAGGGPMTFLSLVSRRLRW